MTALQSIGSTPPLPPQNQFSRSPPLAQTKSALICEKGTNSDQDRVDCVSKFQLLPLTSSTKIDATPALEMHRVVWPPTPLPRTVSKVHFYVRVPGVKGKNTTMTTSFEI